MFVLRAIACAMISTATIAIMQVEEEYWTFLLTDREEKTWLFIGGMAIWGIADAISFFMRK